MRTVGKFESKVYGQALIQVGSYGHNGPLAVAMTSPKDGSLGVLSVNMYKPECTQDSRDLPKDCFYVKTWSENEGLAKDAFKSGLFIERPDLPQARSGYVVASVWQFNNLVTE